MVFIDSNIFMYAAGSAHKNKIPSVRFLHLVAARAMEGCINTEVLQEVLHRYRYIKRWEEGKEVYNLIKKIIPIVIPVDMPILDTAYDLLDKYPDIYARDAVHTATILHHNISLIVSYDRDFDIMKDEIERKEPEELF